MLTAQYQKLHLLRRKSKKKEKKQSFLHRGCKKNTHQKDKHQVTTECQKPNTQSSKYTIWYQREVAVPSTSSWERYALCCYHHGVFTGTCSGWSQHRWSWQLAWTCQENLCKRDCAHIHAHVCTHLREATGVLQWAQNQCHTSTQRSYTRLWGVGIRFGYTKITFFFSKVFRNMKLSSYCNLKVPWFCF